MARKRTAAKKAETWPSDWSVGVRLSVERAGKTVLEQPVADVLAALDRTKSISAAARSLGISYRHAWLLIRTANKNADRPLVETAIGGERGGGAQLTAHGRDALSAFQQLESQVRTAAVKALPKIVAKAADHSPRVVHVAAAISLQEVMALVLNDFALAHPTIAVRTTFSASNELADQIADGGTADVFISASGSHIDRLAKAGLIDRKSRTALASNGLAIVGDASLAGKLKKASDLRRYDDYAIVVADPACPLGECTSRYLESAGLLDSLRERMTLVDNSRAVVASLRAGGRRFGIIFGSDVANAMGVTALVHVPTSRMKTVYEGAAIAASAALDDARELLTFLASKPARANFRRCGFAV
jgi:molybdenum ABC transporter molybdate-binding protein